MKGKSRLERTLSKYPRVMPLERGFPVRGVCCSHCNLPIQKSRKDNRYGWRVTIETSFMRGDDEVRWFCANCKDEAKKVAEGGE